MNLKILTDLLVYLPSLLCILAVLKTVLVIRENKLLARQLTRTTAQLQTQTRKIEKIEQQYQDHSLFENRLETAEITTALQQPRLKRELSATATTGHTSAPEKYNFVHSLTKKGLDVKEISSILSISKEETEQIIALRRIAQGC